MIILLIIGIALAGLAVGLAARALSASELGERVSGFRGRMETYGFGGGAETLENGATMRAKMDDVATRVGEAVGSRTRNRSDDRIRADLRAAGFYDVTPALFLGYRVLCAVGLTILWIWLAITAGVSPGLFVVGTLVVGFLAWAMPGRFVRERAKQRLDEIDYQLPELIDLLVVTVEAGLGFVGSLQMAAARVPGALGDELRLTLQEQRMGLSIQEAMLKMLDRCNTPSMRSFIRSIIQGERLGVSIGQIMRDLAIEMRRRRRAVAQERAQKAPIKILFPLVLLIFPAMFVVLLGPALLLVFKAFSGG